MSAAESVVTYAEGVSRLASDTATECRDHAALHRDIGFPLVADAYTVGAVKQSAQSRTADHIATFARLAVAR